MPAGHAILNFLPYRRDTVYEIEKTRLLGVFMHTATDGHKWIFQHLGGLDQVTLHTTDDLRRIAELDPKLWVALSCPASGLEFDARTLTLIDTDHDGRIRIPEITDAVQWLCARLKDPACIISPQAELPLDAIAVDTPEGERLHKTALLILEKLEKPDAASLSQADVVTAMGHASEHAFNGDGILPPMPELGDEVSAYITDAIAVMGGVTDACGAPGINKEISTAFIQALTEWRDWQSAVAHASGPLGEATPEAWALLQKLAPKIDDYFLRCELAAYAPQAVNALNIDENFVMPSEGGLLASAPLEELPLAQIAPEKPLNLKQGLNPIWRGEIQHLFSLCAPLLQDENELTRTSWQAVKDGFTPYAEILSKKPALPAVATDVPPSKSLDDLGDERAAQILGSDIPAQVAELSDQDSGMPAAVCDIAEVERLVIYYLHLYRLLINFVSFQEFYARKQHAAFQAGTLYIDGRSCDLCLPVQDIAKHSVLAAYSQLYLVYCECRRTTQKTPGPNTMNIVAAMTAGDSELLLESRHGVFVDMNGDDWDATIVKIISNPISLREALFSPYRRIGRMVSEQINKLASKGDEQLMASAGDKLQAAAQTPTEAPPKFDIGKSVGIFAAIGLALGALGTALATIASSLLALDWWEVPLVFVAIFLIISGPSAIIAWLKLRQRTLGPLLEASGWAINGRAKINFFLGRSLTATAVLPPHSSRRYSDPYRSRRKWPWLVFIAAVVIGAAAAFAWFHFKQAPQPTAQHQQAAPAAPEAAAPEAPAPAEAPGEEAPGE